MIKYYGFLKQFDVSVNIFRFKDVVGVVTVTQPVLKVLKKELLLHKAQGIYYFNRFNEELNSYRKFSQLLVGAGSASKTNFEQHIATYIFSKTFVYVHEI